ncbi:DNA repair protein RecO (recombination protein O) [Rubricella aquisinus]|uniref:DNA repair protein RecO n=1 Tax=Rubricella aquisinus TaxID=2028108 RepID=A0A840WNS1_9RHOB|nr:DNA repair protein RecO (recombination protein O) [Rubricella aquisinus]
MIQWEGEGIVLSVRPHGESSAIVQVFTEAQGRHAGVVRGGASRKMTPVLQPGAQVAVEWQARLEDHIGSFRVEPVRSRAGLLSDRAGLAGLTAICGLLRECLPEREAHGALYRRTGVLLDAMVAGHRWDAAYVLWELDLLGELGFGLDLSRCAVTGQTQELAYVSPKSGRAVSRGGAGEWADRLLPNPAFLGLRDLEPPPDQLRDGLSLTGHFIRQWLVPAFGRAGLADERDRLAAVLTRQVGSGASSTGASG